MDIWTQHPNMCMAAIAAAGLLSGIAGYRLLRIVLFLLGASLGSLAGSLIGGYVFENGIHTTVSALVGAMIGGVLSSLILPVGAFLTGVLFGVGLALSVTELGSRMWQPVLIGTCGISSGAMGLVARRHLLIVATSAIGAAAMTAAGWFFITRTSPAEIYCGNPPVLHLAGAIGAWFILAMIGMVIQYDVTAPAEGNVENGRR